MQPTRPQGQQAAFFGQMPSSGQQMQFVPQQMVYGQVPMQGGGMVAPMMMQPMQMGQYPQMMMQPMFFPQ